MKRTFKLGLGALAATGALAAVALPSASAAATLNGAGSSLVLPIVQGVFGPDFASKAAVNYPGGGSGAGINKITAGSVDFGASDAPLTAAQQAACGQCVQVPWALSATGPAYHLAGVVKLVLSGPVLAQIFSGQITMWDDPAIKKLNKGVSLPSEKITTIVRKDGSGDTYAFTDYLSRVSGAFKAAIGGGPATLVSWPGSVGSNAASGNQGVASAIMNTEGAIGYVSTFYLRNNSASTLQGAAMTNGCGNAVTPNLITIANAAKAVPTVPANNEMHIVNPPCSKPKKGKKLSALQHAEAGAWPISTYTYVIARKDGAQKSLVVSFVKQAISAAEQAKIGPYTFAPLPAAVVNAAQKALALL